MFAPHLEPLRHFSIELSTQHSIVKGNKKCSNKKSEPS